MTNPSFSVAIIGAGLGGLAAGIAITRAGHKVTIIERSAALAEVSREKLQSESTTNAVHALP